MMPGANKLGVSVAFGVSLSFNVATAQVLGPLLPKAAAEAGVQITWVDRELDASNGSVYSLEQYDVSIPARYGLTEFATITAQVMTADDDLNSRDTSLRYYLVGAGLQALIWRDADYVISGGIYYTETFLVNQSGNAPDETHFTVNVIAQIQRSFFWRRHAVTVWGGPLFSEYYLEYEEGATFPGATWRAIDIGVALGVNLIVLDHLDVYSNFIHVDHAQPRLGVLYRF
jgi:hypothetical protein